MSKVKQALLMILWLAAFLGTAQDCYQLLEEAQIANYNGNFEKVNTLLSGCESGDMANSDRIIVLQLLTNAALLENEQEKAEEYMRKLLTLSPDYELRSSDLPQFEQLFKQFKITTAWKFGLITGLLIPDYQILRYQSYASEVLEPEDYTERAGFVLGLSADRNLIHRLFISGDVIYQQAGYQQQEILLQYQKVFIKETQHYLALPIQLKYYFLKSRVSPFIGAGFSWHYLLSSRADLDHLPLPTSTIASKNRGSIEQVTNYDLSSSRTTWNRQALIQGGVHYSWAHYSVEAKMTYERGLNNVTKDRYGDRVLIDRFAYVSDDFKRDHYSFSVTFYKALKKPVKK